MLQHSLRTRLPPSPAGPAFRAEGAARAKPARDENADRWSTRRAIGFIILTNGVFWLAAAWGLARLLSR
jgi:hypothetical protein